MIKKGELYLDSLIYYSYYIFFPYGNVRQDTAYPQLIYHPHRTRIPDTEVARGFSLNATGCFLI